MKTSQGDIQIYVACLASYNNGILHGAWINAEQDAYAIYDDVQAMLAASPVADAEEWAIHDYEGFEGVRLSEWSGFGEVAELAAFIAEHGKIGAELITYLGSLEDARKAIEDSYAGAYRSLAEFAEELTEQSTDIPENLRFYIDYDRMARDIEINDVFILLTQREFRIARASNLGFEPVNGARLRGQSWRTPDIRRNRATDRVADFVAFRPICPNNRLQPACQKRFGSAS